MKQLQDYLSGDGKELEYDMELQPFYALPSTKDLREDTLFSKILEPHWLDELSKNFNSFITDHRQVSKLNVFIQFYIYKEMFDQNYEFYIINRIWMI